MSVPSAARVLTIFLTGLSGVFNSIQSAEIIGLGDLEDPPNYSVGNAISADGSVVVGESDSEAFRWTKSTGMLGLGFLRPNTFSLGLGVSPDGSVVVGQAVSPITSAPTAFRWTEPSGMDGLAISPSGRESIAHDASPNGQVIVGQGEVDGIPEQAFRWTADTGIVGLGTPPNVGSEAFGVSADGSVIIGRLAGDPVNSPYQAFRWTSTTGIVPLGFLAPGTTRSEAIDVSADGEVIVGQAINANGAFQAFRWTEADGMVGLGGIPGLEDSWALSVSADGRSIVGVARSLHDQEAFLWSQGMGMQRLWDILKGRGVDLIGEGWSDLVEARGISANGQFVTGTGLHKGNPEAFLVDLGPNSVPESASWMMYFSLPGVLVAHNCYRRHRRFVRAAS